MDCVGEQCVDGVSSKADGVCEKCTESPALLEMNEGSKAVFLHDSGCTHHAIDEQSILASLVYDFKPNRGHYKCGGGGTVDILGEGFLPMAGYPGDRMKVKVTSGMNRNVFSAPQAAVDGMCFYLGRTAGVLDAQVYVPGFGPAYSLYEERAGGLLYLDVCHDSKAGPSLCVEKSHQWHIAKDIVSSLTPERQGVLWRSRLAFESDNAIASLVKSGHKGIKFKRTNGSCVVDNMASQTISGPHKKRDNGSESQPEPYTEFSMDLVDSTVKSVRGYKYGFTIVEMSKKVKYLILMKKKSHTYRFAEEFFDAIIAKYGVKIKRVRPDRGGEFMSQNMIKLFRVKYGAKYEPSETEKPWVNGVAEHAEKDIQRRARGLLMNAGLPRTFWCYAMQHACYLSNLLPHSGLGGLSPQHARDGKTFDYSHLRVFGCPAFVGQRRSQRDNKWDVRTKEGIYVGYHCANKTHIVRFPDGSHTDTTDVEFNELFDPTYMPKGMMATKDSYLNRHKDGSPRLVHQATGEYETPSDDSDNERSKPRKRVTFEVLSPAKKKMQSRVRVEPVVAGGEPESRRKSPAPEVSGDGGVVNSVASGDGNVVGSVDSGKNDVVGTSAPGENESSVMPAGNGPLADPPDVNGASVENESVENDRDSPQGCGDVRGDKTTPVKQKRQARRKERAKVIESPVPDIVRTRSGRARKPVSKDFSPPETKEDMARHRVRKQEQWDRRKKTDHTFREIYEFSDKHKVTDEHAKFCEENHFYMYFYNKATNLVTEYMYSSSTRPSAGEPGSIEEKVLRVPDPKTQKAINAMDRWNKQRFNEATAAEKDNFFADPSVAKRMLLKDVPPGSEVLNSLCIWVSKFQDGKYIKTKARVVIRGDQQPKSSNTFAPTVRFTSMLTLICLAAMFGWRIDKIDYTGAFLSSTLPKPIYVRFPPGLREYDAAGNEIIMVCYKAVYGLDVAPRLWNQFQDKEFRDLGYYQHYSDSCVYSQSYSDGTPVSPTLPAILEGGGGVMQPPSSFNFNDFGILANHVDDGAFITPNETVAAREKKKFFRKYPGTDEGLMTNFCGVRVDQHENGIDLDQEKYIDALAQEYGCVDCKPVRSPIEKKIEVSQCPEVADVGVQKKYWKLCGQLMYLCTHTRPDISYAMNQLTRVAHRPHRMHLAQAHHLLRYLVTTKDLKMKFHRASKVELEGYNYLDPSNSKMYYGEVAFDGYADSSFADCKDTSKSSAGHVFFLGKHQACVEAIAKVLPHVGVSSTENEYVTLSRCGVAGFYLKQFLDELGVFSRPVKFRVYEDSSATLNALKKNVATSKFRHVRTRFHYLRDLVRDGDMEIRKVHTDDQIADLFTKPMFGEKLRKFTLQILGHLPRGHECGEKVDMDYQPNMVNDVGEPKVTKTQQRMLESAGIE